MKALQDTVVASVPDVSETDSTKINNVVPESIVFRSVPDSTVNRYQRDKDFEYANDPEYWIKENDKEESNKNGNLFWELITSKAASIFIYILMGAVLIFALYKIIVDNKLYLFYSKPKKLVAKKSGEEDVNIENIDDEIEKELLLKHYRLAIRYMFLKTLRLLDEKNLIRFHSQGTNHEYTSQLNNTKFGKDFQYLTNVYEYVWYGEFTITDQQGEMVRRNFNEFYTAIES